MFAIYVITPPDADTSVIEEDKSFCFGTVNVVDVDADITALVTLNWLDSNPVTVTVSPAWKVLDDV